MPFVRNRNFMLIMFSIILFVTLFSEVPEERNQDLLSEPSEATSVVMKPEVFIALLNEAYGNNCISGTRIMMESGETARYRYEYIMRNGYNKVVSLTMPYRVTWYRYNDRGYLILDGKRTLMEDKMKDLEDVFLEDLQTGVVEIKISEILYSGIPAYYTSVYGDDFTYRVIVLKQSMNFIRLEKQTRGKQTVMFYDNLNAGDKETFENQMIWYKEIPLGSTFKPVQTATQTTAEDATEATVPETEEQLLAKEFEELIEPLKDEFVVIKTELVAFPDADVMLMTLSADDMADPFVVSIVIYKENSAQKSENLFGKVPENYNHFQKNNENIEVNVIGVHEEDFLKSVAEKILQE